MRIIKFKAKTLKTGEWAVGDLVCSNGKFFIKHEDEPNKVFPLCTKVDTDTVCEFTGLLDKNGKEIYEGDIVRFALTDGFNYVTNEDGVVTYKLGAFYVVNGLAEYLISDTNTNKVEVIGNIHDNPKL